jgi:hypothetical protein
MKSNKLQKGRKGGQNDHQNDKGSNDKDWNLHKKWDGNYIKKN